MDDVICVSSACAYSRILVSLPCIHGVPFVLSFLSVCPAAYLVTECWYGVATRICIIEPP